MSGILEIKTIVEDCRSQYIGGILIGIDMWELAILPMLINNSGTWDDINIESITKLNSLQNTLLRYLLQTPITTPSPALNWDFGVSLMEFQITSKKLCLAKHILSLDDDALAKQIFHTQLKHNFPELAKEVKVLINKNKVYIASYVS